MKIYFLVEEPSAEEALYHLLPQILGTRAEFQVIAFAGKQQLERNLVVRLKGFKARLAYEDIRLVVLVDRDDEDCLAVKRRLEGAAEAAGLVSKAATGKGRVFHVVNRIAIEELEAWFFGDAEALRKAYPRLPSTLVLKAPYRAPDAIRGGTWEALHRELRKAGYDMPVFPKIEVARSIAPHMVPGRNVSPSFQAFRAGVEALLT